MVVFMTSIMKSSHSYESFEDILREENIFDYDRDTVESGGGEDPKSTTSASHEPSRIAPNTFS